MFLHLYVQADALFWLCLMEKFCKIWQLKMHVVKTGKYSPVKFANFLCLYYAWKSLPFLPQMWKTFPRMIQIYPKFANFVEMYFPVFTAFPSQTFAVLLILRCSF